MNFRFLFSDKHRAEVSFVLFLRKVAVDTRSCKLTNRIACANSDALGIGLCRGSDHNGVYPPPAAAVRAPEAAPACHRTSETFNVPSADGGTREITVIGCP